MEGIEELVSSNVQQFVIAERFENLHFHSVTEENISNMPATECSICQSNFVIGERTVSAGCNHLFHMGCLHQWLRQHR